MPQGSFSKYNDPGFSFRGSYSWANLKKPHIKYDFSRKIIIEKILNQKKELIFKKNENDKKIYIITIFKYFHFKKKYLIYQKLKI